MVLKYSPKNSYHLGARYTTRRALGGRFSLGGSVSGRSKHYLSACNNEGGSQEPCTLVDAFVAYETLDGRWRLSLNGENPTDEVYLTGALYSAALRMSPGFLNPPRRFSLSSIDQPLERGPRAGAKQNGHVHASTSGFPLRCSTAVFEVKGSMRIFIGVIRRKYNDSVDLEEVVYMNGCGGPHSRYIRPWLDQDLSEIEWFVVLMPDSIPW